jgi:hypothetical protein
LKIRENNRQLKMKSSTMEKPLFFASLAIATALLSGCTTTKSAPSATPVPEATPASAPVVAEQIPAPVTPSSLPEEMQKLSAKLVEAGGLAAVGTGESKSLELALNKAKVNGRKELAQLLEARLTVLEKAFSEETGIPFDSLFLSGFNHAEKILTGQISGSIAQTLKYEATGHTFTAYAVMVLDPKAIADQLANEKELYARLQKTKAFEALDQEVKSFAAFKAAQK